MRSYFLGSQEDAERLDLERVEDQLFRVTRGDRVIEVNAHMTDGAVHLLINGRSYLCDVVRQGDRAVVVVGGITIDVPLLDEQRYRRMQRSGQEDADDGPEVLSPMAGKVVALRVGPGDSVKAGEGLVIIEAMKMENEIKASRDGVVEAVFVDIGDSVEVGAKLVRLELGEEDDG